MGDGDSAESDRAVMLRSHQAGGGEQTAKDRWKAASASWLRCAAGNSAADVVRSDERAAEPWIRLSPVESS